MPRIDPLQLLTCLQVLLAPNGGIKSSLEVKRIASLMQKFSKKLVSKCIYIQILKCSETHLLGEFMEAEGWHMTHDWLQDAIETLNWPLVQEILELFLLCPVDVNRLKSNNSPKLVKTLSKDCRNENVRILATRLVEQWLKVVKGERIVIPTPHLLANMDSSVPKLLPDPHHLMLDPTHSTYADSLAMVDELNGIGGSADHDIDVDEIIPTLSQDQHHVLMEVDGADFLDDGVTTEEGKMLLQYASNDMLDQVDETGHINNSSDQLIVNSGGPTSNSLSSSGGSSNNNVNQSNEAERSNSKDNLKIKITMKDGKTSLSKVGRSSSRDDEDSSQQQPGGSSSNSSSGRKSSSSSSSSKDKKSTSGSSSSSSGDKSKERRSSSSKSSSSSSSSHHKSSSSSSSSSKRSSSSSKSSSSSSSRDKDRSSSSHKSSSSKSSSSSSKDASSRDKQKEKDVAAEKEAQADKDKDTLAKVMGQSTTTTLGKIPKKVRSEEATPQTNVPVKKSSISIEVRKDAENRPKTVKTFNSQFRNHGLVEDIPPPPSRKTLKKPAPTTTTGSTTTSSATTTTAVNKSITSSSTTSTTAASSLKRASPTKDEVPVSPVSEKRLRLEQIVAAPAEGEEKPGGIKLIAPRSKPTLIESDMFMDALCSSATNNTKVNPKKRKRRTSSSKDGSPPPVESPKIVSAPMKFYQDTLEEATDEKGDIGDKTPAEETIKSQEETPSSPSAAATADEEEKAETASPTKSTHDDEEDPDNPESPTPKEDEMDFEEDDTPKPPGPGCGPNGPPGVLVIHRRRKPKKSVRWRPQESLEEVRLFELDETERVNVTKTFMDMTQMERFGERDAFQMARKLQSDDVMVEQTPWTQLIEVDDVTPSPEGSQSKEREIQMKREQTVLQALYFNYSMIPDSAAEPDLEIIKYTEPAVIPLVDGQNTVNDFTKQGWPEPKEMGGLGGGMGGLPFNGPGGPFPNDGFGGQFGMPPFGGNPGIWSGGGPPFGAPNGMAPFGANLNEEQIKMAMNRLAFPGQQFNPPNFNGINMLNLPAMGAGGPQGNWGFRGPPPQGGQWRGNGPPPNPGMMMGNNGGPRRDWLNNPRVCKSFKKGYCKRGDKCNFLHPRM